MPCASGGYVALISDYLCKLNLEQNEKQGNGHLVLLGSNSMHEHNFVLFSVRKGGFDKVIIGLSSSLSVSTTPIFPTIQLVLTPVSARAQSLNFYGFVLSLL